MHPNRLLNIAMLSFLGLPLVLHAVVREEVTFRGPHDQIVQVLTDDVDSSGTAIVLTNSYVQIQTGLNFQDEKGDWVPSTPAFELVPGAATAWRAQHKVSIAANLNTAEAVAIRLPDDQLLVSNIYGLAYYDTETGQSVLLGEIKDCSGYVVEDTEVIFPDAFSQISADVRYRMTTSSFEQDVILRERPPSPESFGLNPATTRLEVWTEFTGSPSPARSIKADLSDSKRQKAGTEEPAPDEILDFKSAQIGAGRTFRMSEPDESLALVVKHWLSGNDGRKFLVEGVALEELEKGIITLPPSRDGAQVLRRSPSRLQALNALPRKSKRGDLENVQVKRLKSGRDDEMIAQVERPGVVLDYLTLNTTQNNYTFTSHQTYHVTGAVVLTGTTTFEGGTVVKFDSTTTPKLEVQGALSFGGMPYLPVVFTAKHDNTVGGFVASGTPSGSYGSANGALVINNGAATSIPYARFRHLRRGLAFMNGTGHSVKHSQFVQCSEGIWSTTALAYSLFNSLFDSTSIVLAGNAATITAQHLTVRTATTFNTGHSVTLANTLLVGVTTPGSYTQVAGSVSATPAGGTAFETIAGGQLYLPAGSPHRNSGTSTIDSTLATELKKMTTEAPQILTGSLSVNTTLSSRVQRDTDQVDKGYHYDSLDYVVKNLDATAALILTNGVAIAVAGNYGVDLRNAGQLISEGRAENLNRLTRWHNVQEQSAAEGNGGPIAKITANYTTRPVLSLRFTQANALSESGTTLLDMNIVQPPTWRFQSISLEFCQARNIGLPLIAPSDTSAASVLLRNNLFERSTILVQKMASGAATPLTGNFYNNLFWRGALTLGYDSGGGNPGWALRDNLFDGGSTAFSGNLQSSVIRWNNGFTTGTANAFGGSTNKTGLSTDYQSNGTWGNRYYPASGVAPSLFTLINAGSRLRDVAGLYHFTVKSATGTKEAVDTPDTVDIGLHYVGLNGSGQPNDTDGDGIPDYVEDRNGNGSATPDADETGWQQSNGAGSGSGALQVFTPLM
ncbi:MAG: hypothetical protein J0M24_24005 [Verrucomicrobia bacterium]|nr:hypothetical protein [Verrucomicrobiota bacterium]